MRDGTAHIGARIEELTEAELRAPSALPGWTRAHLVGHLARNAEALGRLATWAATGVETPMYASREQRAAEIETSATHPASRLRTEFLTTAAALDTALATLTDTQWATPVRSALGREIPTHELPWMRVRELWLHAVDLNAGTNLHDLPTGVIDLLIDDVAATMSAKDGCPDTLLAPTDRHRTWRLGPNPKANAPEISEPAASIAGWLTGRTPQSLIDAPTLPAWL